MTGLAAAGAFIAENATAILATSAAVSSVAGGAYSAKQSHDAAKAQKNAARDAAAQNAKIANSTTAVNADTAASDQISTETNAASGTQTAARRRVSLSSTVNRYGANGGRLTLN